MKSRILPKSLLAVLTIGLASAGLQAKTIEETVVHQIPVANLKNLDLSNVNGSIKCEGKATDMIELACVIKVKAGSEESAQKYMDSINIDIQENADELIVKTKMPKNRGGFWKWVSGNNTNASVSYEITVPESFGVDLESVNGGIKVKNLKGEVDLETVNGGINAEALSGSANAETVNGGIKVVFTEGASIQDMKFEAVNGGIKVVLPESAAFDTDVSTVNGGIDCEFDLPSNAVKKRRHLNAKINGGGPNIRIETVNGGVGIKKLN